MPIGQIIFLYLIQSGILTFYCITFLYSCVLPGRCLSLPRPLFILATRVQGSFSLRPPSMTSRKGCRLHPRLSASVVPVPARGSHARPPHLPCGPALQAQTPSCWPLHNRWLISCLVHGRDNNGSELDQWVSIRGLEERFPLGHGGCFISYVLHINHSLSFGKDFGFPSFQTHPQDSFSLESIPPKFLWKTFDPNRPWIHWNGPWCLWIQATHLECHSRLYS